MSATDPTRLSSAADHATVGRPPAGRSGRRHRAGAATALAALVVLLLFAGLLSTDPATTEHSAPSNATGAGERAAAPEEDAAAGADVTTEGEIIELDPVELDAEAGGGGNDGGGGGGGGPVGEDPDPIPDPCDDVLATGAQLHVTPAVRTLHPGDTTSQLLLHNCGDADVAWTAQTAPHVTLAHEAGAIAPGAAQALELTVDASDLDDQYSFTIVVSEPGHDTSVEVRGSKMGLVANPGQDLQPNGIGLLPPGHPGCAVQCITTAWLTPAPSAPDMDIELRTHTPATLAVYVSTEGWSVHDGVPDLLGTAPTAANDQLRTSWETRLTPLEPETTYHIAVAATDAEGHTAFRLGELTTPSVVTGFQSPDGPGGCSAECITRATVQPAENTADLQVRTHTPATVEVFIDTRPPTVDETGRPSFPGLPPVATSGHVATEWSTRLEGLAGGTTHHVIVVATDEDGGTSVADGEVSTPLPSHEVRVTFHHVRVHHDGDRGVNRGELRFRFRVGEDTIHLLGERKISSATTVHLADTPRVPGISHQMRFDGDAVPWIVVAGLERDWDGRAEPCSIGSAAPTEPGNDHDCDVEWNVARSEPMLVSDLDGIASCDRHDLGEAFADAHCLTVTTEDQGRRRPRFSVLVSIELLDD